LGYRDDITAVAVGTKRGEHKHIEDYKKECHGKAIISRKLSHGRRPPLQFMDGQLRQVDGAERVDRLVARLVTKSSPVHHASMESLVWPSILSSFGIVAVCIVIDTVRIVIVTQVGD